MPLAELVDVVAIFGGDYGWLFTTVFVAYQIALPDKVGPFKLWDTKLQQIFIRLENKINTILQTQTHHIQVTRALTRKVDGVSELETDNYLRKNGVDVDTFLIEGPSDDDQRRDK